MRHITGFVWVITLIGCGGGSAAHVSEFDGKTVTEQQPLYAEARSAKPHDLTPPTTDVARLASDNAAFGVDLYKAITAGTAKNAIVSPYSASMTMAMLYNGSSAETGAEIASALHFTLPPDRLNAAFNATNIALGAHESERTLTVASSVWARPDGVAPGFLDTLSTSYDTGVFYPNIAGDPDGARKAINQWTAKQTNQKIAELLPPSSIGGNADGLRTELVLVNAIDFEAQWTAPFASGATTPGPFKGLDGVVFQTPMMRSGTISAHAADDEYDAYELPYKGQASLVVIVPHDGKLSSVESRLSGGFIASVFSSLKPAPAVASMPLFSIASNAGFKAALEALGVKRAFQRGPNFPGVLGVAATEINGAYQQARIDVKEDGTKAEAATAVVVGSYPSAAHEPPPRVDIASPFIFVVRDQATNTVLFMGRLVDPR